jgi:hypothetical protein
LPAHAESQVFDIPKKGCSDEGIARIIDQIAPNSSFARTAVARNVKELPALIDQHDHAVRKLEKILAKYLKDPNNVPTARPMCKPSKKDRSYGTYPRGQKVDAIEYYTQRIRDLEVQIKQVRATVDKRGSMPYGFASYADIAEAHGIAYACRKKKPVGATVKLAPRPNDIIWENMPLYSSTRGRRRWVNNMWITLLTLFWIVPNLGIAIFLVNLENLGKVWPAFRTELAAHPKVWGAIQGVLSPAIMSLTYLVLPMIFRRLSVKAGDQTKTGRERHVLAKLYFFFVFNNLFIFSIFSTVWSFVFSVVQDTTGAKKEDAWESIKKQDIAVFLKPFATTVSSGLLIYSSVNSVRLSTSPRPGLSFKPSSSRSSLARHPESSSSLPLRLLLSTPVTTTISSTMLQSPCALLVSNLWSFQQQLFTSSLIRGSRSTFYSTALSPRLSLEECSGVSFSTVSSSPRFFLTW